MTNVNIMIDKATNKTLMAAALFAMAFDNAEIKDNGCSGYFPYEAIITENTLEFDESIKSTRKSMLRMGQSPKLSCIGLVWKHFGLQILEKLECIPEYQEIVWRRIDREFIAKLDSTTSDSLPISSDTQNEIEKNIEYLSNSISECIIEYGTEIYIQQLLNEKKEKCYIKIENGNLPWRKKVEEYNRFSQEGHPIKFVVYPYETGFIGESVELFPTGIPDKLEPQKCFCLNKDFLIEAFTQKITEA